MTINEQILTIAKQAKQASYAMSGINAPTKKRVLLAMAKALVDKTDFILKANAKDLAAAQHAGYSSALVDRLTLTPKRIADMALGVRQTAMLKDNLGELLDTIKRPNGLVIKKVRVPIGVVGIIYESRPNVTCDCAALCFKSGNAVILKGGKEAYFSNQAIYQALKSVLKSQQMPLAAIQLIESTDRAAVAALLSMEQYVDVIVPRGGEGLIRMVTENSRIPVIKHYKGVCHVYVSRHANLAMALNIIVNAKTQKPGVCNAIETVIIDQSIAREFIPQMVDVLINANCQLKGDEASVRLDKRIAKASEESWSTEYLDLILNVRIVNGVKDAIDHINTFGSHHSDSIITTNAKESKQFLAMVDSACVYVNASTRFTDGFEFGFGAEVGISTDKLHVRGPMALEGLTSYKYLISGKGQIRK